MYILKESLNVPELVQCYTPFSSNTDGLVGLVVKASTSGAEDPGFESHLRRHFSGVESYQ